MYSLKLRASELAALRQSQNALLSVLDHDHPEVWQLEVNRAVKRLIGADHAVFSIPIGAGGSTLATDDAPAGFRRGFLTFIREQEDHVEVRDPAVREAQQARIGRGSGAYHMEELGPPGSWRESPMYREVFAPYGFPYMVGISTPLLGSEATQFFGFPDRSAPGYGERGVRLLDLLVPSFVSAIELRHRVAGSRERLAALFDELGEPVALYSPAGELRCRSRRLGELLAGDPAAPRVLDAADGLARAIAARHSRALAPTTRHVRTARGRWRLCAAPAPAGLMEPGVVVLAEPRWPVFPDAPALQARFGLTPRQAAVARLMARGLSDREIADRLTISWHTARRHARDVLQTLDLSSRAAVAMTLLGSPSGSPD